MKKFLVVGAGLAGISMTERLLEAGAEVTVVDAISQPSSSVVATGMYNPIVFRRLNKSWLIDDILPGMHIFYTKLENKLGKQLVQPITFKKRIPSTDYAQLWTQRCAQPEYVDYMDPIEKGFGPVKQAGLIDCETLVPAYAQWLTAEGRLINERALFSDFHIDDRFAAYKGVEYDGIIFCEGPYAVSNPLFSWLPFNICKGEWIIVKSDVRTPVTNPPTVINNVLNIIPLGEGLFKVSSTYSWKDLSWASGEEAERSLCEAFESLFETSCVVVARAAALRPTVADRRPYAGAHPELKRAFIFNGLGSKGVMLGPHLSSQLTEHILQGTPLMPEIDIKRHVGRYIREHRASD